VRRLERLRPVLLPEALRDEADRRDDDFRAVARRELFLVAERERLRTDVFRAPRDDFLATMLDSVTGFGH
jgi:hypothetical protein